MALADVLADDRYHGGYAGVGGLAEFAKPPIRFSRFGAERCDLVGYLLEANPGFDSEGLNVVPEIVDRTLGIAPEDFILPAVPAPFFGDAGGDMLNAFETFLGSHGVPFPTASILSRLRRRHARPLREDGGRGISHKALLLRVTLADVLADRRYEGGNAGIGGLAEFSEPQGCLAGFGGERCDLVGHLLDAEPRIHSQFVYVAFGVAPEGFILLAIFAAFFCDAGSQVLDAFETFFGSHGVPFPTT